jgi:hypothetical protein
VASFFCGVLPLRAPCAAPLLGSMSANGRESCDVFPESPLRGCGRAPLPLLARDDGRFVPNLIHSCLLCCAAFSRFLEERYPFLNA